MSAFLTRRAFIAGAIAVPTSALFGCGGGNGSAGTKSIVRSWTDLLHLAVKTLKPYPPAVARAHAIACTAMFDAWAAYDSVAVGTRHKGLLRRPASEGTDANKQKAVAFAAYRVLVDLFPTMKANFDAEMLRLGYDRTDVSVDTTTPSGIGNTVADSVITFRRTDGSNQLNGYADYVPNPQGWPLYVAGNDPDHINDPDRWQPLRVSNGVGGFAVQKYAGPFWGGVTPFALTSSSQFRPTRVLSKYGSQGYLDKCQVVIDASANLTDLHKLSAEYWADGPGSVNPPGHWMVFADWVSNRDNNDLDQDIKLFFLVANAVLDGGIACWDAKRVYDSVRPVTAIHYAFKDQTIRAWGGPFVGPVNMLGQNFGTFQSETFVTPAFPAYPSGHSVFSAAAAEAMKRFLGSDAFGLTVNYTAGSSGLEPGQVPATNLTVAFSTFTDAANDAASSRIHGGIHFQEDIDDGLPMGRSVGQVVYNKAVTYFNGTA